MQSLPGFKLSQVHVDTLKRVRERTHALAGAASGRNSGSLLSDRRRGECDHHAGRVVRDTEEVQMGRELVGGGVSLSHTHTRRGDERPRVCVCVCVDLTLSTIVDVPRVSSSSEDVCHSAV